MADLKRITLPSGSTYDIVDQGARDLIAALEGKTFWLGVTTTELTDGATTNPITVNGKSVTAKSGDMTAYGHSEFIFTGSIWQEFGDLSAMGDLAYKDYAEGTVTPRGTVSTPTVTIGQTKSTVTPIETVGDLPSLSMTVQNETLTITFDAGALPSKGSDVEVVTDVSVTEVSTPTFTGSTDIISVS